MLNYFYEHFLAFLIYELHSFRFVIKAKHYNKTQSAALTGQSGTARGREQTASVAVNSE